MGHRGSARRAGRTRLALERSRGVPEADTRAASLDPRLPLAWSGGVRLSGGDVWTCGRIAGVIREEFDISYSTSQVSRLVKRLRWAPQVPITRAIQRDEEAIARWRAESWPALKCQARREHRKLVFVDESGFYLLPRAVKTYAPRARTPVLREFQTRDHLSVMGGLTPKGKVYTLVRPTSLNGLHTIEFLLHLGRLAGDRLLVVGDGSPIHRRAEVSEFVSETRGTIAVHRLPPYAPDLNPWSGCGATSRRSSCGTSRAGIWSSCTWYSTWRWGVSGRNLGSCGPSLREPNWPSET